MKLHFSAFMAGLPFSLAYKDLRIPDLTTHQPNGNPDGQVNYYRIAFTVTSMNSGSKKTGYCNTFWGDNSWLDTEAYSLYVPQDTWLPCDTVEYSGEGDSPFAFQLFKYFSIGNFSLEVKEKLSTTSLYGFVHVSNSSANYDCDIDSSQVDKQSHASGDCSIPDGKGPVLLQVYKSEQKWWS